MVHHVFRMTPYQNMPIFLRDGAVYAKNHDPMQRCYRASFQNIVNRRGEDFFTPSLKSVNDFVPFYFSPIHSMAFTTHKGNVRLLDPDNTYLGQADHSNSIFLVSTAESLAASGQEYWFTDVACNSGLLPTYEQDINKITQHINWAVFRAGSQYMTAHIPEIGYNGVCKIFSDHPDYYPMRNTQRMAEFLLYDALSLDFVQCIIVQNDTVGQKVQDFINQSRFTIPVYVKQNCYF